MAEFELAAKAGAARGAITVAVTIIACLSPGLRACEFFGEVIAADDYGSVHIFRDGVRLERVSKFEKLYPGDELSYVGDGRAIVRAGPGQASTRLDSKSGPLPIEHQSSCSARRAFLPRLADAAVALIERMNGPVLPIPTVGSRSASGGNPDPVDGNAQISLAYLAASSPLLIDDTLGRLAIFDPSAELAFTLIDENENTVARSASSGTLAAGALARSPRAGETLKISIGFNEFTANAVVRVTPSADRPMPEWLQEPPETPDALAAYGLWLTLEGPLEWRLHGFSLLESQVEESYFAWRLWHALLGREDT